MKKILLSISLFALLALVAAPVYCQTRASSGELLVVRHASVKLTAAQIIAMSATPVQLVPAQGAGKSIVVTRLAVRITRTSTAFTGGGNTIVQYGNTATGGGVQSLDS